jgi:glucose/arabinose dehydrogenase
MTLKRQQIHGAGLTLTFPLYLTAPPGDTDRLFVVEKGGLIKVIDRGSNTLIGTFLNVSALISTGAEQGLLGMAFDPNYSGNGRFYISYTDTTGSTVVARYLVSSNRDVAISAADRIIFTAAQPFANHNGGMITFGRDGFLYVGRGDGGSGGDPGNRAQNLSEVLGKLLRIDVSLGTHPPDPAYAIPPDNPCVGQPGAREEIWSMGLRNPWRFSFDRENGDLYIGDVGQGAREEVHVSTAASGGGRGSNYGWKIMEGNLCFFPSSGCSMDGLTLPVLDYPHTQGCSITGGYVYRGAALPALHGRYFYADACTGFVRSFRLVNGRVTEHTQWPSLSLSGQSIVSFGEDADGEIYILTSAGGLFRIVQ